MADGEWMRSRSDACERAFAFLADEYGYQICGRTLSASGFSLDYCGTGLGVQVSWYVRDPLTVWLVRLADGAMPERTATSALNYFDLEDFLAVVGHVPPVDVPDHYAPSDDSAAHLAGRLRACGPDLVRGGALDAFPALEQRVRDRAARFAATD